MKGGVVTKLHLIVFLPSILVFWDDKGTLAGSVPQMQDSNQFPKFLVLKKPGGKKSLIEIERKTGRKELVQKQTGRQKIESRDYSRKDGGSGGDNSTKEFYTAIGHNIDLYCSLNGVNWRKQVEWKRENGEAVPDKSLQDGDRLTIPNVERSDEGRYVCTDDNGRIQYVKLVILAEFLCKDVTFGGCPISNKKKIRSLQGLTIEKCNSACKDSQRCEYYRFNHQTKECLLINMNYKSLCQIRAAPVEAQLLSCLRSSHLCDRKTDEDCEYTGNDVKKYAPGEIIDAYTCQDSCKNWAPTCKYWIYNNTERACILKGEGTRICNVTGGAWASDEEFRDCLEDHEK